MSENPELNWCPVQPYVGKAVDRCIVRACKCRYSEHVVVATAEVWVASTGCCSAWARARGEGDIPNTRWE
jgi:hypothetical protein